MENSKSIFSLVMLSVFVIGIFVHTNLVSANQEISSGLILHFYDKDGNIIETPDWFYNPVVQNNSSAEVQENDSKGIIPKKINQDLDSSNQSNNLEQNNSEIDSSMTVNFYDKQENPVQTPKWFFSTSEISSNNSVKQKEIIYKENNNDVIKQSEEKTIISRPIINLSPPYTNKGNFITKIINLMESFFN